MDRRAFFKNLLGGTAAAAIAPNMLAQIIEQDYTTPQNTKEIPVKKLFSGGTGFWVFYNNELVGWSAEEAVEFSMSREVIPDPRAPEDPEGWRNYIPGRTEATYSIDNLYILKDTIWEGEELGLIFKTDKFALKSKGFLMESIPSASEHKGYKSIFQITQETTI